MSTPQTRPRTQNNSPMDIEPPPFSVGSGLEDTLPPYTNNIRLASLCRRKREFQASFDRTPHGRRTWELVWLVLDGTALRVYQPKLHEKKAAANPERRLVRTGSGESRGSAESTQTLSMPSSAARLPRVRGAPLDQPIPSGVVRSPSAALGSASEPHLQLTQSKDSRGVVDTPSASSQSHPAGRGHRKMDSITKGAPPAYPSHLVATPHSASTLFLSSPPSPASGIIHSAITTTAATAQPITTPDFSGRKARRQYHLQHAVCMRADTYVKREHVLRFILEDGKQFMIQLSSREETIAWLQLMHIAAPLSLDLDERPMPEPAQYPRRRPRLRTQTPRRPSTAPGALDRGVQGEITETTIPILADVDPANTAVGSRPSNEEEDDQQGVYGENSDGGGDPLIIEEDMDHLPPPRRPALPRSLSSVEQARRRGIQL